MDMNAVEWPLIITAVSKCKPNKGVGTRKTSFCHNHVITAFRKCVLMGFSFVNIFPEKRAVLNPEQLFVNTTTFCIHTA
jgi:hypothetical protein